ncbi:MAG: Gldg family protein [Anaerolineales bacterium]|nr:Gldg family protein [Anaerolineales bacterium]MCB8962129.1 Gldg family protein [Ardenticatenales bacterium]
MQERLKSVSPYFPWIGLLLIVFGGVYALITREFELITNSLLAVGALFLLLFAVLEPDRVRKQIDSRGVRFGLSTVVAILLFSAIIIFLYYIAYQNNDWRYDVTGEDSFTPLPETEALLSNLDEPIHVIGFFAAAQFAQQDQAKQILENLASITNQITWEFVDPEANPLVAQQYEVSLSGTLVFIQGEGANETTSRMTFLGSTNAEGDIHNALVRVLSAVQKKIYFLEGHGELSIDPTAEISASSLDSVLSDSGFDTESLNLALTGAVPDDASVIVLIDQLAPLQDNELQAISDYLAGGGSMLVARDWHFISDERLRAEQDGLRAYLVDEWGIQLRTDAVIDPVNMLANVAVPIGFGIFDFGVSPIVNDALSGTGLIVFTARSVALQPVEGITQATIAQTSAGAWGETNLDALLNQGIFNYDAEADSLGPVAIAVSADNSVTGGRVVVVGDTDLFTNDLLSAGANYLLASNALNWLSDDEVSIAVTPRDVVQRQVVIPLTQMSFLWFVSLCFPSLIAIIIGVAIFVSRRRRVVA